MKSRTVCMIALGGIAVLSLLAIVQVTRALDFWPPFIYLSTRAAGQTEDGVVYGPEDILVRLPGNAEYQVWFDGSEHGLKPKMNNINAFAFPEWDHQYGGPPGDIAMTFVGSPAYVPDIPAKVYPQDIVWYERHRHMRSPDVGSFYLEIDGSDVGLNLASEAIDALSWIDPSDIYVDATPSFIDKDCSAYGLYAISTAGPYVVPAANGGWLKGSGSDVLLFCPTQVGYQTEGYWYRIFNGTEAGITPRKALDTIIVDHLLSLDGQPQFDGFFGFRASMSAPAGTAAPSDWVWVYGGPNDFHLYNMGNLNQLYPRLNGIVDAYDYWYPAPVH